MAVSILFQHHIILFEFSSVTLNFLKLHYSVIFRLSSNKRAWLSIARYTFHAQLENLKHFQTFFFNYILALLYRTYIRTLILHIAPLHPTALHAPFKGIIMFHVALRGFAAAPVCVYLFAHCIREVSRPKAALRPVF